MAMKYNFCKLALLSSSLFFGSNLQAETPPPPPEEAIRACGELNAGDQCGFKHPQGTMEGVCLKFKEDLACGPVNGFMPPIGANFDATSSMLFLPTVSVDEALYFRVSLLLVGTTPVLLDLTEVSEIDKPNQVSASYTSKTGTLSVPSFKFDAKRYSLELKLIDTKPRYQFELTSISEISL